MTTQRIGWIGLGVMGAPMCEHLLRAGHDVAVFTRTMARARPLVELGARRGESPAEVAADADVIVTMVGFPDDVREVVLGQKGVLSSPRRGSVLVDMTTSQPQLALEIDRAAAALGVSALDAPVSGGDVGARNGQVVVMVGGDQASFERVRPLLEVFSKAMLYCGGAGSGQHAKMANQIAIASGMIGVCESLCYAHAAGLDAEQLLECIGGGAAGSWSLQNYGPRILRQDLSPGFKVDHFIKDLGIALEEAARARLSLPGLALARELYLSVSALGLGEKGVQSLVCALERLSNRQWTLLDGGGAGA